MSRVAGSGPGIRRRDSFPSEKERAQARPKKSAAWFFRFKRRSHGARIYTEKPLGHILEQNDLARSREGDPQPRRTAIARTLAQLSGIRRRSSTPSASTSTKSKAALFSSRPSCHCFAICARLRNACRSAKSVSCGSRRQQKKPKGLAKSPRLLTSSGQKLDQRYDTVNVTDYFRRNTAGSSEIELDPAITLRENIERMFKRQQKAGRGKQIVATPGRRRAQPAKPPLAERIRTTSSH